MRAACSLNSGPMTSFPARVILLSASRTNAATALRDAASNYKVDIEAITAKVKQEFAAKKKVKKAARPEGKSTKSAA